MEPSSSEQKRTVEKKPCRMKYSQSSFMISFVRKIHKGRRSRKRREEAMALTKPRLRITAPITTTTTIAPPPTDAPQIIEPMTPAGRLFSEPIFNCHILVALGFLCPLDLEAFKADFQNTFLKHKRFCSIVKRQENGELYWVPVRVNIDDHFIIPEVQQDEPNFVQDYMAKLATSPPLDPKRPLWEIHILNAKLGEASTNAVFRLHHSLGDGVSLMSLLLACTRRVDQPDLLPTIPKKTAQISSQPTDLHQSFSFLDYISKLFWLIWRFLLVLYYTCLDVCIFLATAFWLEDSNTPIKGSPGVEFKPKILAYSTFSFEDVLLVKRAISGTVNDVMLGMLSAGLTRYLQHHFDKDASKEKENKKKTDANRKEVCYAPRVLRSSKNSHSKSWGSLRVRSSALVNIRPSTGLQELHAMMHKGSPAPWGNRMAYVIVPIFLGECKDPLEYARRSKAIADQKKMSREVQFTYISGKFLMNIAGTKVVTKLTYRCTSHATLSVSNVVGPLEQVQLFGNPIMHIIPTVYGHPQSLCVHFQSYMGKMTVVAFAARDLIPDPERLCQYMMDALQEMKQSTQATMINS